MSDTIKNIAIILIILTVAFGGYVFFVQSPSGEEGDISVNEQELQAMLAQTSVFIERSQELDQMMLDTSILEDARFRSLRTFSKPLREEPIGRPDPFAPVFSDDGLE